MHPTVCDGQGEEEGLTAREKKRNRKQYRILTIYSHLVQRQLGFFFFTFVLRKQGAKKNYHWRLSAREMCKLWATFSRPFQWTFFNRILTIKNFANIAENDSCVHYKVHVSKQKQVETV